MNFVWGSFMAFIGLFLFLSGLKKSKFILYKLLHTRAKSLWGDHAHSFLAISGLVITGLSTLLFLGIWG